MELNAFDSVVQYLNSLEEPEKTKRLTTWEYEVMFGKLHQFVLFLKDGLSWSDEFFHQLMIKSGQMDPEV